MENTQRDQKNVGGNVGQDQKRPIQNPSTDTGSEKNFGSERPQRDTAQTNTPRSDDAKRAGSEGSTRQ